MTISRTQRNGTTGSLDALKAKAEEFNWIAPDRAAQPRPADAQSGAPVVPGGEEQTQQLKPQPTNQSPGVRNCGLSPKSNTSKTAWKFHNISYATF